MNILILLTLLTSFCYAQVPQEKTKSFVYEFVSADGKGKSLGTGFAIGDSILGYRAMITCNHVIQDTNGNYLDSIFIRKNRFLSSGQIISDTTKFVLRLIINNREYFFKHRNVNIDLAVIPIMRKNTTLPLNEDLMCYSTQDIINKDEFDSWKINEGTNVELVGFSLSSLFPRDSVHYHFSRFGKIGLFTTNNFTLKIENKLKTANYILLDMVIRPGDSGSPILTIIRGKKRIIGFALAYSRDLEYGVGYPIYYLNYLVEIMEQIVSGDN